MKPSIVDLCPDLKAKWAAQDKREKELTDSLRVNCVDALEDIASALRFPKISLRHIENAIAKLTVAKDCARVLDE